MKTAKDAKTRKEAQRQRQAALGIKRVELQLSAREREQLDTLRRARAGSGSGEPYSADEYISTLLRRDWELWVSQVDNLKIQVCKHCNHPLPDGCNGAFKGESACWKTAGDKTLAL